MSLVSLICLNLSSIFVIVSLNDKKYLEQIKSVTLGTSILSFFLVLYGWWQFDYSVQGFQYFFNVTGILYFGCDGLSLSFLLLTTFLFPIFILVGWYNADTNMKILCGLLIGIELLLILVFSVLDLFGFYIFFELLLLPMIYLIAMWGADERKDFAILYFFLYTLFGSLCMLLGLILLYYEFGTTNIQTLYEYNIPLGKQQILWWLFFIPLAIKIPMVPGHLWLLEAHPEAPTIGSMILAGLLLKLGTYGFVRILMMVFIQATDYYRSIILTISLIGLIYTSFILLLQYDIKRIIAYSSVAHMNYGLLGLFSESLEGIAGALVLMISHGFTSSGLFLLAGLLYDRFHDRVIYNYSGLIRIMPLMAGCFFLVLLSNFGFPGSLNFIGEVLIFFGIFETANILALLSCVGLFLSLIYSILLFNRLFFGELVIGSFANYSKRKGRRYGKLKFGYRLDLLPREVYMILPLILAIFLLGIYPMGLLRILEDILFYVFLSFQAT